MFTQLKFLFQFLKVVFLPVNIKRVLRLGDYVMQAAPENLFDEKLKKDPYLRSITKTRYIGHFPTHAEKSKYAPGTLGYCYLEFLAENDITPYSQLVPVANSYPNNNEFLKERVRYLRDLLRLLLNLETTYEDEAALSAFLFSQFPSPLPAAVVGGVILKAVFSEPLSLQKIFSKVVQAYRCGESSRSFIAIKWETMWDISIDEARAQLAPTAPFSTRNIHRISMI